MSATIDRWARAALNPIATPIARALAAVGVTADMVTFAGLLGNIYVAFLIIEGRLRLAGIVMLAAGLLDALDGAVARVRQKTNRSGALLDSVIDRYSEAVIFFGLLVHFFKSGHLVAVSFSFMAIIGSLLVSYIRARAEGLNIECRVGLMQRGERIVLLSVGLIGASWPVLGQQSAELLGTWPFLVFVLGALAVLSNVTAIHRLIFSYAELHRVHRG